MITLPPGVPLAEVDVARQLMTVTRRGVVLRTCRVSTAAAGIGAREGSGCTPPGWHRVKGCYGGRAEPGQVLVSRRAVKGQILPPEAWRQSGGRDYVLTRLLWLEGLEPGINAGPGIDSHARYIYIHGTNQEHLLGTPASHGCIRVSNEDVLWLFSLARRHGLYVKVVL